VLVAGQPVAQARDLAAEQVLGDRVDAEVGQDLGQVDVHQVVELAQPGRVEVVDDLGRRPEIAVEEVPEHRHGVAGLLAAPPAP
jgi:hypothetical protein